MQSRGNDVLLYALVGVLVTVGAAAMMLSWVGRGITSVMCGARSVRTHPVELAVGFVRDGGTAFVTADGQCAPATWAVIAPLVVGLVVVAGLAVWGVVLWRNWKESDAYLLRDLARRDGVAKGREVKIKAGEKALMAKASAIRPTLKNPRPADIGMCFGLSCGYPMWVSSEDSVVLIGPPRSGKGFYIVINALLDAPGAVVTTSTRGDNVRAVWEARAKIGPVALFDPQGLTKLPTTLKWAPHQGCESVMVASRRAQTIVGASAMGESTSNQEWAGVATRILTGLLHAAALAQVDTPTLGRWGSTPGLAAAAVKVLRSHPDSAPGWAEALDDELNSDPRMLPSKWMGVSEALSPLMLPEVAAVLNPAPGEGLDPKTFIEQKGTLFLVGTKTGGGAAAPMLMALMDEITAVARELAIRSPGNRLSPGLSLILDEIANLAPWKELPVVMADGGGVGIFTLVVLQSPAMARAAWGDHLAQQILDAATVKFQLGGSGNSDELQALVTLIGQRVLKETNTTWADSGTSRSQTQREKDVITVAELRRLPVGTGLVLTRTSRPIVVTMAKWVDRPEAPEIKAAIARFDERLAQALVDGPDHLPEPQLTAA